MRLCAGMISVYNITCSTPPTMSVDSPLSYERGNYVIPVGSLVAARREPDSDQWILAKMLSFSGVS